MALPHHEQLWKTHRTRSHRNGAGTMQDVTWVVGTDRVPELTPGVVTLRGSREPMGNAGSAGLTCVRPVKCPRCLASVEKPQRRILGTMTRHGAGPPGSWSIMPTSVSARSALNTRYLVSLPFPEPISIAESIFACSDSAKPERILSFDSRYHPDPVAV
jgi:hypothetical protein